jgi:hypothetical protein
MSSIIPAQKGGSPVGSKAIHVRSGGDRHNENGLMIWGLRPGPMLFVEQKDFVWGLIASMYMGNVVSLIVVLARCRCSPRSFVFRSRSSRR